MTFVSGTHDRVGTRINPPISSMAEKLSETKEHGWKMQFRWLSRSICSNEYTTFTSVPLISLLVDGGYSPWSAWSRCSTTCNPEIRRRERSCSNPPPQNGGKDCSQLGNAQETKRCNKAKRKRCKGTFLPLQVLKGVIFKLFLFLSYFVFAVGISRWYWKDFSQLGNAQETKRCNKANRKRCKGTFLPLQVLKGVILKLFYRTLFLQWLLASGYWHK